MGFKINGQESQHATLQVTILANNASLELFTFSKVNYKVSAKKKPTQDSQGKTDGYTIGNEETSGDITIRRTEYLALKRWLKTQYPNLGIGQIRLSMQLKYSSALVGLNGSDEVVFLFDEEAFNSENNQEAHMCELPIFVMDVNPAEGRFIQYRP